MMVSLAAAQYDITMLWYVWFLNAETHNKIRCMSFAAPISMHIRFARNLNLSHTHFMWSDNSIELNTLAFSKSIHITFAYGIQKRFVCYFCIVHSSHLIGSLVINRHAHRLCSYRSGNTEWNELMCLGLCARSRLVTLLHSHDNDYYDRLRKSSIRRSSDFILFFIVPGGCTVQHGLPQPGWTTAVQTVSTAFWQPS